jgi:hypothetical protein
MNLVNIEARLKCWGFAGSATLVQKACAQNVNRSSQQVLPLDNSIRSVSAQGLFLLFLWALFVSVAQYL